jgi:hypothetical protein
MNSMSEQATAFPLHWPLGWKRTEYRQSARFRTGKEPISIYRAMQRLQYELDRLGAERTLLSTNVETRLDGTPRSDRREPNDPGAAIYFVLSGRKTVMACDKWFRVADNIAALAAHIECLRGIDRYGVGSLEQAFRGYQQLEDFTQGVPWRRVLGFKDDQSVTLEMVEARFRELAKQHHPDTAGGDHLQMSQITEAIADARKELRKAA